jgi:flagellar biosynthesis GTPase FlhF
MKTRLFELLQSPEPGSEGGDGAGLGGGIPPAPPTAEPESGDDLSRLRHTLDRERNANREKDRRLGALEAQLKELTTTNPDAVRAAEAKAQQALQERQLIEERSRLERDAIESKYSTQLQQANAELQTEREARQRELVRQQAEKAFAKAKGSFEVSVIDGSTGFDSVWARFGPNCRTEDGVLVIVDSRGNPEIDTETGRRFDPVKWFERLRPDPVYGRHFEPAMGSGSGARSSRDGRVSTGKDLMAQPLGSLFSDAFGGAA